MSTKRTLSITLIAGTLALALACTGANEPTSTPTTPAGNTPTTQETNGGGLSNGIASLILGSSSVEAAGLAPFVAPQVSSGSQQAGIWVGGSGKVTITPDLAILTLGVDAKGDTVQQARDDAATAMADVMLTLADGGVLEQDIRTQYFNIQPEYVWNDKDRIQEITGYRVTNTLSVKVRDLEGVGVLIDQVADAAGDLVRINGIRFTAENPEQFASQAREAAAQDALAKARQFADLTGVNLGSLVYIAEAGSSIPTARSYDGPVMATAEDAFAPAPTQVSPGEMDITVTVQAVFAIS